MKTQNVIQAYNELKSPERPKVLRVYGDRGINWRRLLTFAQFAQPRVDALSSTSWCGNPTLPDSLEEWLASYHAIEIGSTMAPPDRKLLFRT